MDSAGFALVGSAYSTWMCVKVEVLNSEPKSSWMST